MNSLPQFFQVYLNVRLNDAVVAAFPFSVLVAYGVDYVEEIVAVVHQISVERSSVQVLDFSRFVAEHHVDDVAFFGFHDFHVVFRHFRRRLVLGYRRSFIFARLVGTVAFFGHHSAVGVNNHTFAHQYRRFKAVLFFHIGKIAFHSDYLSSANGVEVAYYIANFHNFEF